MERAELLSIPNVGLTDIINNCFSKDGDSFKVKISSIKDYDLLYRLAYYEAVTIAEEKGYPIVAFLMKDGSV